MRRALLDPLFTNTERRWGGYMGLAVWFASATLLGVLVAWSLAPG